MVHTRGSITSTDASGALLSESILQSVEFPSTCFLKLARMAEVCDVTPIFMLDFFKLLDLFWTTKFRDLVQLGDHLSESAPHLSLHHVVASGS